jgi:hypothetical protein
VTETELEARTQLWGWVAQLEGCDESERGWSLEHFDAMLLASERTGLVPVDELERFRSLGAGATLDTTRGDSAVARRHLDALATALRPMSRTPDDGAWEASQRFHDAQMSLEKAGLLDGAALDATRRKAVEAELPWLDDEEMAAHASGTGPMLVAIPASSPEEIAQDAAFERDHELMLRRGDVVRVLTCGEIARHHGLAVTAVVLRTESTEVHFHHLGKPEGEGPEDPAAFFDAAEAIGPADLRDDAGTSYAPAPCFPTSASGPGGVPDPERPRVIVGNWRYVTPAPAGERTFTVTLGDATWTIP